MSGSSEAVREELIYIASHIPTVLEVSAFSVGFVSKLKPDQSFLPSSGSEEISIPDFG